MLDQIGIWGIWLTLQLSFLLLGQFLKSNYGVARCIVLLGNYSHQGVPLPFGACKGICMNCRAQRFPRTLHYNELINVTNVTIQVCPLSVVACQCMMSIKCQLLRFFKASNFKLIKTTVMGFTHAPPLHHFPTLEPLIAQSRARHHLSVKMLARAQMNSDSCAIGEWYTLKWQRDNVTVCSCSNMSSTHLLGASHVITQLSHCNHSNLWWITRK